MASPSDAESSRDAARKKNCKIKFWIEISNCDLLLQDGSEGRESLGKCAFQTIPDMFFRRRQKILVIFLSKILGAYVFPKNWHVGRAPSFWAPLAYSRWNWNLVPLVYLLSLYDPWRRGNVKWVGWCFWSIYIFQVLFYPCFCLYCSPYYLRHRKSSYAEAFSNVLNLHHGLHCTIGRPRIACFVERCHQSLSSSMCRFHTQRSSSLAISGCCWARAPMARRQLWSLM